MGRPRKSGHNAETRAVSTMDELREFEQFKKEILPALQEAVRLKKPSEEILELVRSHAAARLATIALLEPDSQKAMLGIEKVLQRTDGPVVQKSETDHRFGKLPEEQLDALIATRLNKVSSAEGSEEDG